MASAEPIALEPAASSARLPWVFRLTLASPRAPWLLAGALAVLHLVVAGIVMYAIGATGERLKTILIVSLDYSLYFACVPVAAVMLRRGAERDLAALAPVVGLDARSFAAARGELLSVTPRAMRRALAFALGLAVVGIASFVPAEREVGEIPWAFVVPREILIDVLIWSVLGWGVAVSVRMARLFRERAEFSLLDSTAPAPVVRCGLRVALWWLILFAIAVPAFTALGGDGTVLGIFGAIAGIGASLAIPVLYLPLAELRRRIRSDKAREIAEVRRQIHAARAERDELRLPGLLAWEARIASVSEWPIDADALRRLGLFLLLPLGSWVGGALVERVVDSALR